LRKCLEGDIIGLPGGAVGCPEAKGV
jgi:hypothetical protein